MPNPIAGRRWGGPAFAALALLTAAGFGVNRTVAQDAGREVTPKRQPNVVFILTDNHGAWTLGCYGNRDIRTPHLDRLADHGTLFTRVYSSNPVCSPTRATFLTGLMPSQHGVHSYLRANDAQIGPKAYSTLEEFRSLPEILAGSGYTCGLSGKWHLGANLKPQEGFTFWTTMPHGHTTTFHNAPVIENGAIRQEPTYLTDYWTKRGVEFIEQNRARPFFLYLAYNGPYGLGASMLEPIRNRHAGYYADKVLPSFPREAVHPWLRANRNLINQPAAMRRYAAEVSAVDDGVGEILETLRKHGLERDTLIVFAGDQGLAGGHGGLWGMGDHTRPLSMYDPTLHIPLILHQPGRIPAGRRSDIQLSNYDLYPTVLRYLGLENQIPAAPPLPGRSFLEVLQGHDVRWDDATFHEFENVRAVRTPRWKYVERIHEGPNELYDLAKDPMERSNLVEDLAHVRARDELQGRLKAFFTRYTDPKWDLWKGGRSKSGLATAALFKIKNPAGEAGGGP